MITRYLTPNWVKFVVIAFAVAGALVIVANGADAAPQCKKVQGHFTLTPVSAPECTSLVGLCATGKYTGSLEANSEFTGTSLSPTVDTPVTAVAVLTGDNLIHTKNGDLLTKDAIVLRTIGAGEFAEVDTIIGGTGEWAGASGILTAVGTFTSAGGEGDYSGEICIAN